MRFPEPTREKLVFDYIYKNYWGFLTRDERADAVAYAWKKGIDVDEAIIKDPYRGGGDGPGRIVITQDGKILRFSEKK